MAEVVDVGCARPAGGPVGEAVPENEVPIVEGRYTKMVDGGVPFPMLSDAGGKIGRLFGIFNEAAGVEIRY